MFRPAIVTWMRFEDEQMSPMGSTSPSTVYDPPPPSMRTLGLAPFFTAATPFVWPETRFSAPGTDGPNVVWKKWSLMAKRCA